MAVWPASFPPPALNSLREQPADNRLRSPMDKGPAKMRRRTTANVKPLRFEMNLTSEQVSELEEFYEDTLFSGVDPFDFTHPRTGQALQVRFVDRPEWSEREGVDYRVSISLEILP